MITYDMYVCLSNLVKIIIMIHLSVSLQYDLSVSLQYDMSVCLSVSLQISLYCNVLGRKHSELLAMMERLEGGLEKLKSTAAQVDDLKEKLAAQEVRSCNIQSYH